MYSKIIQVEDTGERSKGQEFTSPVYNATLRLTLDTGEVINLTASSPLKRELPKAIARYSRAWAEKLGDTWHITTSPLL